jgi:hypothetical protein
MRTEGVVSAADGLSRAAKYQLDTGHGLILGMNIPGRRANTDNGDGAACNPDKGGNVADSDAQETEERANSGRVRSLDAVAALESASVALVGGGAGSSCGGSKGCNGNGGKSGELELHIAEMRVLE